MRGRAIKVLMSALAVLVAPAIAAAGAQGAPSLGDALGLIERGKYVRLEVDGAERSEGRYLEVRNDSLCIAQGEWEIATAVRDVRALWTRERATRPGAIAGGITGGVAGAALGALLYALITSLCDTGDCGDYSTGGNVIAGLAGGLAGGLMGGLAGGVIGAAIPRWVERYRASEMPAEEPTDTSVEASTAAGASAGSVGDREPREARLPYRAWDRRGGYGLVMGALAGAADCSRNAAPYTRFMLHVNASPHWTLVPEAGFTWRGLGQTSTTICGDEGVSFCKQSVSTLVLHAGLAARYTPYAGDVQPYLTAGAGGYAWNESFLGYSVGVGTMLDAQSHHPIELELRYHANLQRLAEECPSRLVSLTAGVQVTTW